MFSRDAHDAVRERDGARVLGERIRVEIAKGTSGPPPAPRDWRDKGTGFRIIVDGLPKHASWQDLKVLTFLVMFCIQKGPDVEGLT